ncbi:hypothetical protein Tco_0629820 [Tanacetum coccineum]|uniref:Uncharacterized protein n=1 Tax=Tanacetum coccineum TaxID=301880 RepID=A0ABQ4WUB0_9ASTR
MSYATSDVTISSDDKEVSEGGIPRVIVLGYDGLPIQPVAPPSPDYIPQPRGPTGSPPIPQDESDPEEDPEEYEDDETEEDGPVDYPYGTGEMMEMIDDVDSSRDEPMMR